MFCVRFFIIHYPMFAFYTRDSPYFFLFFITTRSIITSRYYLFLEFRALSWFYF